MLDDFICFYKVGVDEIRVEAAAFCEITYLQFPLYDEAMHSCATLCAFDKVPMKTKDAQNLEEKHREYRNEFNIVGASSVNRQRS